LIKSVAIRRLWWSYSYFYWHRFISKSTNWFFQKQ